MSVAADPVEPDALTVKYPAIDVAYGFVFPSYQMLISRFEAADSRITSLLTVASTVTLAAPVIGRSVEPGIVFDGWFGAGVVLFVLALAVGMVGRIRGCLWLPNPGDLYKKGLHETPAEFKKNAIHFAGIHFDKNAQAIDEKGWISVGLVGLTTLEVLVFLLWIVR